MGCIYSKRVGAPAELPAPTSLVLPNDIDVNFPDPSRLWIPDLVCRYAACLPPNEVPCTLRLVNKATAAQLSSLRHTTIQPILPVPPHYFHLCWGASAIASAAAVATTTAAAPSQRLSQRTQATSPAPAAPSCGEGVAGPADAGGSQRPGDPAADEDPGRAGHGQRPVITVSAVQPGQPAAADGVHAGSSAGGAATAQLHGGTAASAPDGIGAATGGAAPLWKGGPAAAPVPEAAAVPEAVVTGRPPPPPRDAYRGSCGGGGDLLWLSGRQRAMLLNATAASGVVENLEVLLDPRLADFFPRAPGPLVFAAVAGRVDVVWWLRARGFPWGYGVLRAAVRSGNFEFVKKAMSDGLNRGNGTLGALGDAAAAGHTPIYDFFLQKQRRVGFLDKPKFLMGLLEDVAYGCSLGQLKDILANPPPYGVDWEWMHVTAFAASSPTPDWREKVEWLEEQGHDKNVWAAERVVKLFGVDWQRAGGGSVHWGMGLGAGELISADAGYWGNAVRDDARLAAARIAAAKAAGSAATAAAIRELRCDSRSRRTAGSSRQAGGGTATLSTGQAAGRASGGGQCSSGVAGGGGLGRQGQQGSGGAAGSGVEELGGATALLWEDALYGYTTDDDNAASVARPARGGAESRGTTTSAMPAPASSAGAAATDAVAGAAAAGLLSPGAREAIERLTWLRDRGYPIRQTAVAAAAAVGNMAALQFLLTHCVSSLRPHQDQSAGGPGPGPGPGPAGHDAGGRGGGVAPALNSFEAQQERQAVQDAPLKAAKAGHLSCLKLLRRHGYPVASAAVLEAAVLSGRLRVVAWALEELRRRARSRAAGGGQGDTEPSSSRPTGDAAVAGDHQQQQDLAAPAGAAGAGHADGDAGGEGVVLVAAGEAADPQVGPAPAAAASQQPLPEAPRPQAAAAAPSPPAALPPLNQLLVAALSGDRTRAQHTATPLAINALVAGAGQALSVRLLDWLQARQLLSLQHPAIFAAAAAYGARPGLEWCGAHGCSWDTSALEEAARSGSVSAVEWLVARGCPVGDKGVPYITAASGRHMIVLRALRRLGVTWGLDGSTFDTAVRSVGHGGRLGGLPDISVGLSGLRLLRDVGCPINWDALKAMVKDKREPPASLYEWRKQELGSFMSEAPSKALRKQWKAQQRGGTAVG